MRWALGIALFMVAVASAPVGSAEDRLYQCQDGTFTNRPERLCAPYNSTGVVVIMPKGATMNSVRAMLHEPETTRPLPDPRGICTLYEEWVALNLRTEGGHNFQLTQDRPRWIALSRVFTAIGTPNCR